MRLQWSEIRARAAEFSERWQDAGYEKGETHTFYEKRFEVFGVSRRQVGGRAGHHQVKADSGFALERRAFRDGG